MKNELTDSEILDLECKVFEHMMARPGSDEDSVNATLAWMRSDPNLLMGYLADAHEMV
jgi:hypothetical protein